MTRDEIHGMTLEEAEQRLSEINGKFMIDCAEMFETGHLKNRIDQLVGPSDPRHSSMLEYEPEDGCISVYWSYEYNIDLSSIQTPQDALSVVSHIAMKRWRHSTPKRVALLIDEIMKVKGWGKFEKMRHPNEAPPAFVDAAEERVKMTPQLRYQIIKRDGYRCRACGFAVQDGARLHVDHIHPVSKGGATVEGNLQTLCASCNLGKGAD